MADIKTEEPPHSPEIHFEPIVKLDRVETKTLEEDEEEVFKMRSKLFRYDTSIDPPEWKERGVGDVKILRHKGTQPRARVLMRRDKTLKICANHFITPVMKLQPNCGSERAWVWSTPADFADEEAKGETLAIRFANVENAQKFKDVFEECQRMISEQEKKDNEKPEENSTETPAESSKEKSADEIAEKLGEMTVKETGAPAEGGGSETGIEEQDNKDKSEVQRDAQDSKDDSEKENSETKKD
ncbi:ran-specific GTPase-activating protein-like [Acanthaster planci]|uniref:Ran-specific GTPase-activating protein-like n=1 Tax=Acanthaster planci TaxID=133434 RepID=A0A8B7ZU02_ACAPL|nr:ran-specific GTPase-activating protein-like [Acanthaster planci]